MRELELIKQMETLNLAINTQAYKQGNKFAEHTTARIAKELEQLKKDFEPFKIAVIE